MDGERPLADRMRPREFEDFVGQEKIIGPRRALRKMIEEDRLQSLIFWGPPGTGKTTLARLIARRTAARFVQFSAVSSGIREVREVMSEADSFRRKNGRRTVVFIDEIHRFNKAQQDAFLPYVESGTIILIGATTENPSFEVNSALLSRSKVFVLEPLTSEHLVEIMRRAIEEPERGIAEARIETSDEILGALAVYASGDARVALNTLELAAAVAEVDSSGKRVLTKETVTEAMQRAAMRYDKAGEEHFNLISAFIKSIRNSDADAAVYWLARMLESGEDPLYVARRLVVHASEDIGLADPMALVEAVSAFQAAHFIGLPEAKLALTQATLYLALAPKSNSVIETYGAAQKDALETEREPVPLHLRNAPTGLMKGLGYGEGYKYAHSFESGRAEDMECLPEGLRGRKYYKPNPRDKAGK
ncbi:MAG TPA: replication-associated recombination protein A [Blastocatellia bacterium]|nr:replication-associated recombination protein A [Blastocatellia bacterium]